MNAARHKSERHMRTCILDCFSRWESAQLDRFSKHGNKISRWQSIGPASNSQVDEIPLTPDSHLKKELPELADWWVLDVLKVPPNTPPMNCTSLLSYAMKARFLHKGSVPLDVNSTEKLLSQVYSSTAISTDTKKQQALQVLANYPSQAISAYRDSQQLTLVVSPQEEGTTEGTVGLVTPVKKKKPTATWSRSPRVRGGNVTIPERSLINKTSDIQSKYAFVTHAISEYNSQYSSLTRSDQTFLHRIKRFARCVEVCYDGDIDEFAESNPKFALSKYHCDKC